MAKVMTILEQACSKFKPALNPNECHLIVHEGPRSKRTQDLTVPFRLANIPTNAKIEVVRGEQEQPKRSIKVFHGNSNTDLPLISHASP